MGDQSHPVRSLFRTQIFSHAKDAKAGTGDEGIQGLRGEWDVRSFAKQTRRALRSVGPSCDAQGNRGRLLPVIFFADDFLEVEW